jgi:hypothetical protein
MILVLVANEKSLREWSEMNRIGLSDPAQFTTYLKHNSDFAAQLVPLPSLLPVSL